MRRAALLLALLLPACATTKSPEQLRVEEIAGQCLRQRDRATLQEVEVDTFGRLMVRGRQTADWPTEFAAFQACLDAKGIGQSGPATPSVTTSPDPGTCPAGTAWMGAGCRSQ